MTGDIQKRGVLFMFGGSRVLKMVPEVIINMGGNKKLVIGSIHETQENGPTPSYVITDISRRVLKLVRLKNTQICQFYGHILSKIWCAEAYSVDSCISTLEGPRDPRPMIFPHLIPPLVCIETLRITLQSFLH